MESSSVRTAICRDASVLMYTCSIAARFVTKTRTAFVMTVSSWFASSVRTSDIHAFVSATSVLLNVLSRDVVRFVAEGVKPTCVATPGVADEAPTPWQIVTAVQPPCASSFVVDPSFD